MEYWWWYKDWDDGVMVRDELKVELLELFMDRLNSGKVLRCGKFGVGKYYSGTFLFWTEVDSVSKPVMKVHIDVRKAGKKKVEVVNVVCRNVWEIRGMLSDFSGARAVVRLIVESMIDEIVT